MPPQNTQPNNPQVDPNQAAANLGFVTTMQQQLLEHQANQQGVKPSVEPKNAPEQEKKPEDKKEAEPKDEGARIAELELSITKKLDEIRKELKGDAKSQIDALKKDIETALKEDEQEK